MKRRIFLALLPAPFVARFFPKPPVTTYDLKAQTTIFVKVTDFEDSYRGYVDGLPDISGTLSGFWDDTDRAGH